MKSGAILAVHRSSKDWDVVKRMIGITSSKTRRGAFALLELVVAIAILALLSAILLPAIQSAREASRRLTCSVNLKQIALASHSYADSHGVFYGRDRIFRSLLDQLEFEVPSRIVRCRSSPKTLLCPSDELSSNSEGHRNYRICVGSGRYFDGAVPAKRALNARDVTDGLSNTAFYSEKLIAPYDRFDIHLVNPSEFTQAGADADPLRYLWYLRRSPSDIEEKIDFCLNDRGGVLPFIFTAGAGITSSHEFFSTAVPPNHPSCAGDVAGVRPETSRLSRIDSATSRHPGVNVAFLDGSSRHVSSDIDADLWRSLGTRAGGEMHGGF